MRATTDGWPDDPQTLALLRDRTVNDPDLTMRRDALEALAAARPPDPDTLSLLRDRAVNDPVQTVREAAAQAAADWPTE